MYLCQRCDSAGTILLNKRRQWMFSNLNSNSGFSKLVFSVDVFWSRMECSIPFDFMSLYCQKELNRRWSLWPDIFYSGYYLKRNLVICAGLSNGRLRCSNVLCGYDGGYKGCIRNFGGESPLKMLTNLENRAGIGRTTLRWWILAKPNVKIGGGWDSLRIASNSVFWY
jgi:hypothetical protein